MPRASGDGDPLWESFGKNVVAPGKRELSQRLADNDKADNNQG